MRARFLFFGWIMLLAGATTAHALLGDDLSTAEQHYGRTLLPGVPVSGGTAYVYSNVGYRVVVVFQAGRSVCETFYRLHAPKGLSAETLDAFLKLHSAGQTWRDMEQSPGRRVWRREGAMAFYLDDSDLPELVVATTAFVEPPPPPVPVAAAPPPPTPPPVADLPKPAPAAPGKPAVKVGLAKIAAVQCHAFTKKGERCTHMTTNPNGFCWQHQIPPKGQPAARPSSVSSL